MANLLQKLIFPIGHYTSLYHCRCWQWRFKISPYIKFFDPCWLNWNNIELSELVLGGDLRPTFRNTYLCKTIKKERKCLLLRLILSFYPLDMAFWSFPIFAHYKALQYFVQDNLWIYWFNKQPFWLLKFPWTISEGSIKNSFFKPLKKVLKN